jgi:hypothetical protein
MVKGVFLSAFVHREIEIKYHQFSRDFRRHASAELFDVRV